MVVSKHSGDKGINAVMGQCDNVTSGLWQMFVLDPNCDIKDMTFIKWGYDKSKSFIQNVINWKVFMHDMPLEIFFSSVVVWMNKQSTCRNDT